MGIPRPPSSSSWGSDRGITNTKAEPDGVAAIDLTINFEFNSAALTSDGEVLVGNLGRALNGRQTLPHRGAHRRGRWLIPLPSHMNRTHLSETFVGFALPPRLR